MSLHHHSSLSAIQSENTREKISMKRKVPSSSSSSSSSSSCIECSPIAEINNVTQTPLDKPKPKRVRAKKVSNDSSAASAKSRSSIYRGVTRHRWTGRYEAHLWDKSTWNSIQSKRGRQIYLGAYDNEEDAARTYDLAALKFWGPDTVLNFPVEAYTKDVEEMQKLTKEEFLASLRRRSSGFSRGVSKYRGVARHHHNGRWEARIGRVCGNKYLYLGTYSTQEEAAVAYDMAAIEFRGPNAVTNFDISNYADKLTKVLPEEHPVKQEANPIPVNAVHEEHDNQEEKVQPDQLHDHQEDVNKVDQTSTRKLETSDLETRAVMDPTEEHEHPWDLYLDTIFNILPIPEMPQEKASEIYDYKGFDDNIEHIFDDPFYGYGIVQDAVSGDIKTTEALNSSLLSTASVCSNI